MILVRGPQSQRKSSSADAPVWKDRESKQCDLSSYFAALQPLCTAICGGKCARKWHFHGSWLCAFRPTSANDAFDPALWETFVSTTLGLEVPTLAALPRLHKAHNSLLAKCGCKKFCMDFDGDHTSTCTAHSGATKAHDWMVSVLGQLFRRQDTQYALNMA